MKHSVDLQALALRTGNILVSKLWPILNRATINYSPVIKMYGLPLEIYRPAYGYCRLARHTKA